MRAARSASAPGAPTIPATNVQVLVHGLRDLGYDVPALLAATGVAYLVGYSESAPFYGAFKRWYGVTPESVPSGAAARMTAATVNHWEEQL